MSGHADTIRLIQRTLPPNQSAALDALLDENQRYEKALQHIAKTSGNPLDTPSRIAREALVGDTEPPDPDTSPFETPSFETVEKGIDWIDRRVHGDDS